MSTILKQSDRSPGEPIVVFSSIFYFLDYLCPYTLLFLLFFVPYKWYQLQLFQVENDSALFRQIPLNSNIASQKTGVGVSTLDDLQIRNQSIYDCTAYNFNLASFCIILHLHRLRHAQVHVNHLLEQFTCCISAVFDHLTVLFVRNMHHQIYEELEVNPANFQSLQEDKNRIFPTPQCSCGKNSHRLFLQIVQFL